MYCHCILIHSGPDGLVPELLQPSLNALLPSFQEQAWILGSLKLIVLVYVSSLFRNVAATPPYEQASESTFPYHFQRHTVTIFEFSGCRQYLNDACKYGWLQVYSMWLLSKAFSNP